LFSVVFLFSNTPMSCTACNLYSNCGHFLLQSTISLGRRFPEDDTFAACHCFTAIHLPAGDSQLHLYIYIYIYICLYEQSKIKQNKADIIIL
jgi:hypothetical protein